MQWDRLHERPDGWENVQGNLNEAWRQFSANVGTPLLANLVPIIQNITASLIEWTNNVDWTAFSDAVNSFVSLIMDNGPSIVSTIAGIGAGFAAWNVVTMIQGVVSAVNAFRTANEGLKLSQVALNAVMKANPLALVASLVAGLVTAIIVLWNTNEDFRKSVGEIWEAIKGFFVEAWESIKAAWDVAGAYFKAIWSAISAVFQPVSDYLSKVFTDGWNAIKKLLSGWASFFGDIWEDVKNIFSNAGKVFSDIGRNIVNGIKNGISNAWNSFTSWVSGKFNGLVGGVEKLLGIHSPSKVFAGIGEYLMEGLAVGVDDGTNAAVSAVEKAAKAISGAVTPSFDMQIPALALGTVTPKTREFTGASSGLDMDALRDILLNATAQSAGSESTGGGTYKFEIYLNGRKMAVEMVKEVNNMTIEAGKPVLLF